MKLKFRKGDRAITIDDKGKGIKNILTSDVSKTDYPFIKLTKNGIINWFRTKWHGITYIDGTVVEDNSEVIADWKYQSEEDPYSGSGNIVSIDLPNAKIIGKGAFYGQNSMENINLPNVEIIQDEGFAITTVPKNFEMPKLKKLGRAVFQETGGGTSNFFAPNLVELNEEAFYFSWFNVVFLPKIIDYWASAGGAYLKYVIIPNAKRFRHSSDSRPSECRYIYAPNVEEYYGLNMISIGELKEIHFPNARFLEGYDDPWAELFDTKTIILPKVQHMNICPFSRKTKTLVINESVSFIVKPWGDPLDIREKAKKYGVSIYNQDKTKIHNLGTYRWEDICGFYKNGYQKIASAEMAIISSTSVTKSAVQVISRTAKTVARGAFSDNSYLNLVTLPNCIELEDGAFAICKQLTEVWLTEVVSIGREAFVSCEKIEKIEFPKCKKVGMGAFAQCGTLEVAFLPECIELGDGAFAECPNLKVVLLKKGCRLGTDAIPNGAEVVYVD